MTSYSRSNPRAQSRAAATKDIGILLVGVSGQVLEACAVSERIFRTRASSLRGSRIETILGERVRGLGACSDRERLRPSSGVEAFGRAEPLIEIRPLGEARVDSREAVIVCAPFGRNGEPGPPAVLGRMTVSAPISFFALEPPRRVVVWITRSMAAELDLAFGAPGEAVDAFFRRRLHQADVETILRQIEGRDLPDAPLPMPASFRICRKDGSWHRVRDWPGLVLRRESGRIRWIIGTLEDDEPVALDGDEARSSRILGGVSDAANALISPGDLTHTAPAALVAIGRALNVERLSVRQFRTDDALAARVATTRWEWEVASDSGPAMESPSRDLPFDGPLGRWLTRLAAGGEVAGVSGWLDEEEQAAFDAMGMVSALAVPIQVFSEAWGCLELIDGRRRREWTVADRDAARILASHLGHAIERSRSDYRVRTLSRAIEQSSAAIVVTDTTGRIQFVNPAFAERAGHPADDLLGSYPAALAARGVDSDLFVRLDAVVREGEEWRGELRRASGPDGSRWSDVRVSPARGPTGQITHFVLSDEDVTERKLAEERIRTERGRYKHLFEAMPALVWRLDQAGRCLDVNQRCQEATGQSAETAASEGWLTLFAPADRGALESAIEEAVRSSRSVQREVRLVGRDDLETWYLVELEPIAGPTDGCEGILGAGIDITAIKKSERALSESQAELRSLTARLVSIREEERRLLARELHDGVGQALTGLALELASLERSAVEGRADLHRRLCRLSREVADTLADVRDLARRIRPAVLELGLVPAIEGELKAFGRRSGVEWDLDARGTAQIDPERALVAFRFVQEALTNVIRHAAAKRVRVSLHTVGGDVLVEVADDGKGFDPASQGGLGLVGLRERVAPWGGSVRLEPNRPRGTTAAIEIPASPPGPLRSAETGS